MPIRLQAGIISGALFCLTLTGCGKQSEPPTVKFAQDAVTISSGMYRDEIEYQDILSVTTVSEFPQDVQRSNGFDYKSQLRGSFKLADGRSARVYVDTSVPPIIKAELADGLLFLNGPDAETTQEYYYALVDRTTREE